MKKALINIIIIILIWLACGSDTAPPNVTITNPLDNSIVGGNVIITINATDNTSVTEVNLYINTSLVESFTESPYRYDWITDSLPNNSTHAIYALALDEQGNMGISDTINVEIFNDTTGVSIYIWNYDELDKFYDTEVSDTIDCSYWLEQSLLANGYTPQVSNTLPSDLSNYDIVFVTVGWFRC